MQLQNENNLNLDNALKYILKKQLKVVEIYLKSLATGTLICIQT